MGIKVSELEGIDLDLWVMRAIGKDFLLNYSTKWEQCGPLIEEYQVEIAWHGKLARCHTFGDPYEDEEFGTLRNLITMEGPTPLIAACRCIVASKYGEEVDEH